MQSTKKEERFFWLPIRFGDRPSAGMPEQTPSTVPTSTKCEPSNLDSGLHQRTARIPQLQPISNVHSRNGSWRYREWHTLTRYGWHLIKSLFWNADISFLLSLSHSASLQPQVCTACKVTTGFLLLLTPTLQPLLGSKHVQKNKGREWRKYPMPVSYMRRKAIAMAFFAQAYPLICCTRDKHSLPAQGHVETIVMITKQNKKEALYAYMFRQSYDGLRYRHLPQWNRKSLREPIYVKKGLYIRTCARSSMTKHESCISNSRFKMNQWTHCFLIITLPISCKYGQLA